MKNKVNIAEILKDCPPSMKLYSPIFGDVYLNKIRPHLGIVVTTDKEQGNIKEEFLYDGRYGMNGECMLFPSKDKTTWEGFVPPCKFKDGDILYIDCTGDECSYKHNKYIFILKEISDGKIYCYCYIDEVNKYKKFNISWLSDMTYTPRFATEEEKQKLFDAIKENGYKWNEETKTLEKLIKPKFKVGDRIRCKNCVEKYDGFEEGIIDTITDNKYGIVIPHLMGIVTLINITDQDNWELVTLKFKTGDRIRRKIKRRNYIDEGEIKSVSFNFYDVFTTDEKSIFIPIREQDEWELVPNKIELKFKDGDILYVESVYPFIVIYNENENEECFYKYVAIKDYPDCTRIFDGNGPLCHKKCVSKIRFATKEEKQKLFQVIEAKGYRWNPETKNLEKLIEPKFKVGDVVQDKDDYKAEITEVNIGDECYEYISKIAKGIGSILFEDQDNWELVPDDIKPKFNVGDRVKHKQSFISGVITNIDDDCYKIKYDSSAVSFAIIKYQDDWELVSDEIEPKFKVGDKIKYRHGEIIYRIVKITEDTYVLDNFQSIPISIEYMYNLVPNKFDTSTLKPFESRVLVRDSRDEIWKPAIFGCYNGHSYSVLGGIGWKYCIPYEGNEHLCGKTDDCDEYYKTWE